jgi:2-polyprenyl-6-methoxyphenol hydroxylase-like FAD-dependent oxidoreductase
MSESVDVVIVGAGPTGMWLACELALQGVRTCILERRTEPTIHSRAMTLHPRTLEVLDMRGLVDRFLEQTPRIPTGHYSNLPTRLDFSVLNTRHPYTAFIAQARTEALMEVRVRELGVPFLRGHEVLNVEQTSDAVSVHVRTHEREYRMTSSFVVGCDGGNSIVRKALGVDFPGTDATVTGVLGDVRLARPPERPLAMSNAAGTVLLAPLGGGLWRFACQSASRMTLSKDVPLTLEELRATVTEVLGDDFGLFEPFWLSRFGDTNRLAARYRVGRAFLAGDAAHIHFPAGGVGLNVGVQDAMNLGWKLALATKGFAGEALLETYHTERHPVGAELCRQSRAQVRLFEWTPNALALRDTFSQLLQVPGANRLIAEHVTGMAVDYSVKGSSQREAVVGSRVPDLALDSGGRLYEHLHRGQFALIDGIGAGSALSGWADRVRIVNAKPLDAPDSWAGATLVLCRPDGHLAWLGDRSTSIDELCAVVQSWCGASAE